MISDAPLLGRRWLGGLIIDYSRAVLFGVEVWRECSKIQFPKKGTCASVPGRLSAAKKSYMREDVESTVRYVSTYTRRNGPPERFRKTKVLRKLTATCEAGAKPPRATRLGNQPALPRWQGRGLKRALYCYSEALRTTATGPLFLYCQTCLSISQIAITYSCSQTRLSDLRGGDYFQAL